MLADPERYVMEEEERADFERLAVFLGAAAAQPSRFRPQGKNASRVRSIVRKAKGPAQPQSRRNKRKARQAERQRFAKFRRAQRREMVAAYNAAVEAMEADRAEAEAYMREIEEQIKGQPRVDIVDPTGQQILGGVPISFIKLDGKPLPEFDSAAKAQIVLPGSFEKAQEREAA